MDNMQRAQYGANAVQMGTPDRGQNDDHTDAVDTIANILHFLAVERPEYDARTVAHEALEHFLHEVSA